VKIRLSEEEIVGHLREAKADVPIKELCPQRGCNESSYYPWRSKFCVALKQVVAEQMPSTTAANWRANALASGYLPGARG